MSPSRRSDGWRPDGGFPPRSRPIRTEDGIRARSGRGRIGSSWWSQRFLAVLDSFDVGTRLARGRSYARAGQVLSLVVSAGEVSAEVQGSRPRPYRVRIGLAPFSPLVWAKLEVALAEQAIYSARLLAGELPPEVEEVCARAGAPLFPTAERELDLHCTCPDLAVPCKHLAATCYLFAEELDRDPFVLLHWRGRQRAELLAKLRALRGDAADAPTALPGTTPPPPPPAAVTGSAGALSGVAGPPLAETLDRFWSPPVPLPRRPATLAAAPDLLIRQLPPPPAELGGSELQRKLVAAYERLGTAPSG